MNEQECARIESTVALARAGAWTDDAREHARRCPDCAAALAVEEVLPRWSAALRAEATPASADSLLWRARLQERIARAERAARPVAIFDRLAVGVAVALAALGLAWRGRALADWFGTSLAGSKSAPPELLLLAVVTIGFAGALFWVFGSWAEE